MQMHLWYSCNCNIDINMNKGLCVSVCVKLKVGDGINFFLLHKFDEENSLKELKHI